MYRFRIPVFVLLTLSFFLVSTSGALADENTEHFEYEGTFNSMVVLVLEVTLDDEDLEVGDEIGIFTPEGVCAGGWRIEEEDIGEMVGMAAWPNDPDQEGQQGFLRADPLEFLIWEESEDEEWDVEVDVAAGDIEFSQNGFVQVNLASARVAGDADIELSADVHDFGVIRLGNASEWVLQIANVGGSLLTVSNIQVEGDGFSTDYEDGDVEIEPDAAYDLTVTFDPEEEGEYEGTITITSDDPDEEEQVLTVALSGVGEITPPAEINVVPMAINFDRALIGSERSRTVRIQNTGGEILTVSGVEIAGDGFEHDFADRIEIEPEAEVEVVVTFSPEEVQEYEATMTISSDDEDEAEVDVSLRGLGVEQGDAVISLSNDQHFFGNVIIGEPDTWRLVIYNDGDDELLVESVESDNEVFTNNFGIDAVRLRPGDFWNINVTFLPEEEAYFDGILTITSNDQENGEMLVHLGGVSGDEDGFHFRYYGTEVNHLLVITEATLGDDPLEDREDEVGVFTEDGLCAGSILVEYDEEGRFGLAAWGNEVPVVEPGEDPEPDYVMEGFVEEESFAFKVWDASAGIEVDAVATFDEERPDVFTANSWSILTLAAGIPEDQPDVELSRTVHFYGQVLVDESESWTLTIFNVGPGVLTVDEIDSDFDEYDVDFGDAVDVNPNESIDVEITFTPSEMRRYDGRLEVRSNDPIDPIVYCDLFGEGVQEVNEPEIVLGADNHFFGARHLDSETEWALEITNDGGDDLMVMNVEVTGDNADYFSTGFVARFMIEPGDSRDLGITFTPEAAGEGLNATVVITWNDPANEGEGTVDFEAWGEAQVSDDHFLHHLTANDHSMLVLEAMIEDGNGNEFPLVMGDEIAVFTPSGLCAGHFVVEERGEAIGFGAWADDGDTPYVDGFAAGEGFAFKFYDSSTDLELDCDVEYLEGPQEFEAFALTQMNLRAEIEVVERQIAVDPEFHMFGALHVGNSEDLVVTVSNPGGMDLTINRVESDNESYTTDFGDQARLLEPDQELELTITFAPERVGPQVAEITIFNDDPDPEEQVYTITMNGMGADNEEHYAVLYTDVDHTILIMSLTLGEDELDPAIGDEIGLFTPRGFCAGVLPVEEPGEPVGGGAVGDDAATEDIVEGFEDGELILFHFWDAGAEREYTQEDEEVVVEILQGDLEYSSGEMTQVNVNVPDAGSGFRPVVDQRANEGGQIDFDLEIINPPGDNIRIEWTNQALLDDLGDIGDYAFEDGGFTWDPNHDVVRHANRVGRFGLGFAVFDDDNQGELFDRITVTVIITDVDQVIEVVEDHPGFDEDNPIVLQEDGDPVALDFSAFYNDPDLEDVEIRLYETREMDPEGIVELDLDFRTQLVTITPMPNVSGLVTAFIDAQNPQVRLAPRGARSIEELQVQPINSRAARSIEGIAVDRPTPRRDPATEVWILVEGAADPPVPTDPHWVVTNPQGGVRQGDGTDIAMNEGDQLTVTLMADDPDLPDDELTWTVEDQDDLPGNQGDQWDFRDNDDDTGTFEWQTGAVDGRQELYTPVFRVTDSFDATDVIGLEITVNDFNQAPFVENPIDDIEIPEDSPRIPIADLNDVFSDPDPEDPQLNFEAGDEWPNQLRLQIVNGILSAQPVANFWQLDPPLVVQVKAIDRLGAEAIDEFTVIVTPVNDPPGPFNLLLPAHNAVIASEDTTMSFAWQRPAPVANDDPDEVYTYTVVFYAIPNEDDTFYVEDLDTNDYPDMLIQDMLTALGLDRSANREYVWWVWAHDQDLDRRSRLQFHFILWASIVESEKGGVPGQYYLYANYPNPFNASTTVAFGLPKPGSASVNVWDMHGRLIAELAAGRFLAGRYDVVWTPEGLTSGVYMIRMQAGDFRELHKAILLR